MTEPAPDPAAAQIAREVLTANGVHCYAERIASEQAAALARADRLCEPGTLAEVERLREFVGTIRGAGVDNAHVSYAGVTITVRRALAALDAATAGTAGDNSARPPGCVHGCRAVADCNGRCT